MHFIRALYDGKLVSNDFRLMETSRVPLQSTEGLLVDRDGYRYLVAGELLRILYLGQQYRVMSGVRPLEDALLLPNGFYDARSLQWSGWMTDRRVGDLLPLEYEPGE
jgi:hypothetical protein